MDPNADVGEVVAVQTKDFIRAQTKVKQAYMELRKKVQTKVIQKNANPT